MYVATTLKPPGFVALVPSAPRGVAVGPDHLFGDCYDRAFFCSGNRDHVAPPGVSRFTRGVGAGIRHSVAFLVKQQAKITARKKKSRPTLTG